MGADCGVPPVVLDRSVLEMEAGNLGFENHEEQEKSAGSAQKMLP